MPQRILVTGGAGFIGSHLCDALLARGYRVVAVDDLSLGRRENVAHLLAHPAFTLDVADVCDDARMDAIFRDGRFTHVFHLAANSDIARSTANPDADYQRTFLTTYRILNQMRRSGVTRMVFTSTPAVYGEIHAAVPEHYGPLVPISHYGAAKLASEAFIASFVANYGIQAWVLRIQNTVGERATHGVLVDFLRKLHTNPAVLEVLGNGEQTKPYIYVRDLVDAMLFVWERAHDPINLYHLGTETRTTVKDIVAMVASALGLTPEVRYAGGNRGWVGDQPEYAYDLTKLHRLGWRAPRTSDEAVRLALERMLARERAQGFVVSVPRRARRADARGP